MTFRVGQKVVCVDDIPSPGKVWYTQKPTVGHVYTVSGHGVGYYGDYPVIFVAELNNPLIGYRETRFRPIVERKTDISIFKAMLTPASKKELAK